MTLKPGAVIQLERLAQRHQVPSFGDVDFTGNEIFDYFANCMSITRNNFANFSHIDNDLVGITYGWWWAAHKNALGTFSRHPNIDHDQIRGGEFTWPEYGFGVQFEKCVGLVEIYWRGKKDRHVTLASTSDQSVTRFGTSIQLTEAGVGAFCRFWENGTKTALTGYTDRVNKTKDQNKYRGD